MSKFPLKIISASMTKALQIAITSVREGRLVEDDEEILVKLSLQT